MTSRFIRTVAVTAAIATASAFTVPLTAAPAKASEYHDYGPGGYGSYGGYGRHGGYGYRSGGYGYRSGGYGYRRGGYGYRRHHHGGAVAGAIFGLAAGAIIAGAASQQRYGNSYSSTRYNGYAPEPWSDEWYAYCASKYRSFDPDSGTFQPYNGPRRLCR